MNLDQGSNYLWALPYLSSPIRSIIEVGSRDGFNAVELAQRLNSPVIAFECDPQQFPVVRKNIDQLGPAGSMAFEVALSDRDSEETFWAADPEKYTNLGTGSFFQVNFGNRPRSDIDSGREPIQRPIRVTARRFDSLGLSAPDLLVMDVQGAEIQVLSGFGPLLSQCRYIICEAERVPSYKGGKPFSKLNGFLKNNGFRMLSCTIGSGRPSERWVHYWMSNLRLALKERHIQPWRLYQGVFDVLYVNTR